MSRPWYEQEIATMQVLHSRGIPAEEIANRMGREVSSVASRIRERPIGRRDLYRFMTICLNCGYEFLSQSRLVRRCAACRDLEMNRGVDLG